MSRDETTALMDAPEFEPGMRRPESFEHLIDQLMNKQLAEMKVFEQGKADQSKLADLVTAEIMKRNPMEIAELSPDLADFENGDLEEKVREKVFAKVEAQSGYIRNVAEVQSHKTRALENIQKSPEKKSRLKRAFESTKKFVKRHKKGLIITAAIVIALSAIAAGMYYTGAWGKLAALAKLKWAGMAGAEKAAKVVAGGAEAVKDAREAVAEAVKDAREAVAEAAKTFEGYVESIPEITNTVPQIPETEEAIQEIFKNLGNK